MISSNSNDGQNFLLSIPHPVILVKYNQETCMYVTKTELEV